jgi:hypothetical protein
MGDPISARFNAPEAVKRLIVFFVVSYASSWLLWELRDRLWSGSMFVEWLGGFGPAFSAILVSALYDGRDGVRDLLSRLFIWRVNVKWYWLPCS